MTQKGETMTAEVIVKLEADSIADEGVVALAWCEFCPLNAPPDGDEAYAISACGDQTFKGEHCRFWQDYHIDKNGNLLVTCVHPEWTYGPGRWIK
jgi:hypothetical protein